MRVSIHAVGMLLAGATRACHPARLFHGIAPVTALCLLLMLPPNPGVATHFDHVRVGRVIHWRATDQI